MRRFSTLMLAIVSMSMICGFVFGILYTATNAEIYVADNAAYLQIAGQAFMYEYE